VNLTGIERAWARDTTARMQSGGDLYHRPLTREEMTAPLADGSIGFEVVP